MKRLTIPALALLLILMTGVTLHADRPEMVFDDDLEDRFQVVNCVPYGHDFEVWDDLVGHLSEKWYWDNEGHLAMTVLSLQGADQLYKADYNGEPLSGYLAQGPVTLTAHCYPDPDTPDWARYFCRVKGVGWNIQLPGEGTVYHASGQHVDEWQLGDGEEDQYIRRVKRAGLDQFDSETLCEFFAR